MSILLLLAVQSYATDFRGAVYAEPQLIANTVADSWVRNLTDVLCDRALKASPLYHSGLHSGGLDETTSGKPTPSALRPGSVLGFGLGVTRGTTRERKLPSMHRGIAPGVVSSRQAGGQGGQSRRKQGAPGQGGADQRAEGPWAGKLAGAKAAATALAIPALIALCPMELCGVGATHAALQPPELVTTAGLSNAAFRGLVNLDASIQRFKASTAPLAPDMTAVNEEESALAKKVVEEAWSVVDVHFLDVRNVGFDRNKWASLRDDAQVELSDGGLTRSYGVVRRMLARGIEDPYTRFLEPSEVQSMVSKYDVSGVGLNVGTEEDYRAQVGAERKSKTTPQRIKGSLRVIGVVDGPAKQNGIVEDDEITQVDGQSVLGKSAFDVLSLIQEGPPGSATSSSAEPPPVVITVVRSKDGQEMRVEVPRKVISDEAVLESRIEQQNGMKVGYVRLPKFDRAAEREFAVAIDQLSEKGAESIVLDLRGNTGGLVTEGTEIANLFLDKGEKTLETVIVNRPIYDAAAKTQLDGETVKTYMAEASARYAREPPLTVLVDGLTASASEIMTGALQDNCRAVVVGDQTFGKGLIQSLYALSDGSGIITTAGKYRLPSGRDLDRDGITPNFQTMPTAAQAKTTIKACEAKRQK